MTKTPLPCAVCIGKRCATRQDRSCRTVVSANFRIAGHPGTADARSTTQRCDIFRDAARVVAQMSGADPIEEGYPAVGMPLNESDGVVCTIPDSIVRDVRSGAGVEIRGLGSFHTRRRRGLIGRYSKTGAQVEVPPKRIPFFKPSKELRDIVDVERGESPLDRRKSLIRALPFKVLRSPGPRSRAGDRRP